MAVCSNDIHLNVICQKDISYDIIYLNELELKSYAQTTFCCTTFGRMASDLTFSDPLFWPIFRPSKLSCRKLAGADARDFNFRVRRQ
jgi:hypothetical protein